MVVTRKSIVVLITLLAYVCKTNALEYDDNDCPEDCYCSFTFISNVKNLVTDCSERNITFIPYEKIDKNTYLLDLIENPITKIESFPAGFNIQIILLTRSFIIKIYNTTFVQLRSIISLDLSSNLIYRIHPEAFKYNTELISLKLDNNPLEYVSGPFLHSIYLQYLYLSKCQLTKLSPEFFSYTNKLEELDLSGNPLYTIEPIIFDPLIYLKHLNLNNCSITHIHNNAFKYLKQLLTIKLAENNLKNIDNWSLVLGKLGGLHHLDLRLSGLTRLPKNVFNKNILLVSLILAENNFSNFDLYSILSPNLIYLEYLDVSYCHLKISLTNNVFANITNIRILMLTGNHIDVDNLRKILEPLVHLEKLSLKDCGLKLFPVNHLHEFVNLRELDISKNSMAENFMDYIRYPFKLLRHLDMGYTNLEKIDNTIFSKMPVLKTLILSGNKFKKFDLCAFENLLQLKLLELNNCGISYLNDVIHNGNVTYFNLNELSLSGNPLQIPVVGPMLPLHLSHLKNLDLSNCNLSFLPEDTFINTPHIEKLFLNKNKLNTNENNSMKFLESLTELQQLDLRFNEMTSIKPSNFDHNSQLESLKLVGNPWVCECYIVDMLEWVASAKGILDLLADSVTSITSNEHNKKAKGLMCIFDQWKTPIRKPDLWGPHRVLSLSQQRTWAWYVREGMCPQSTVIARFARNAVQAFNKEKVDYEEYFLT